MDSAEKVRLFFSFLLANSDSIDILSVMRIHELERRVEQIKAELAGLGLARPGTLYERTSVCGKPGCRCVRKDRPVRHGPYHYLSYSFDGRSHTEFVAKSRLAEVQGEVANYERLTALVKELVATNIKLSKLRKEKR